VSAPARRTLIALVLGFLTSLVVSSTFVRPTLPYQRQPVVQQLLIMFVLPLSAALIVIGARSLQKRQWIVADALTSDQAVESIVFWIVLFLMLVHLLMLAVVVGIEAVQPWASRAVVMLGGFTLVTIGNLLPRTRPNVVLGVRTTRSLTSRGVWLPLHRLGGYVCVALGLATLLIATFLPGPTAAALTGAGALAGALILCAYYQKLAHPAADERRCSKSCI
jgi:hypothetical protein